MDNTKISENTKLFSFSETSQQGQETLFQYTYKYEHI